MRPSTTDSLREALEELQTETGLALRNGAAGVAIYAQESAGRLMIAAGQPGFVEAAKREAASLRARAAEEVIAGGEATDARLRGLLLGFLLGAAG